MQSFTLVLRVFDKKREMEERAEETLTVKEASASTPSETVVPIDESTNLEKVASPPPTAPDNSSAPKTSSSHPRGRRRGRPTRQSTPSTAHNDESSHRLETKWTFWYSNKANKAKQRKHKKKANQDAKAGSFGEHLIRLGTCSTVEGFGNIYRFLQRPSELTKSSNYHFFRGELAPMWEVCNFTTNSNFQKTDQKKKKKKTKDFSKGRMFLHTNSKKI